LGSELGRPHVRLLLRALLVDGKVYLVHFRNCLGGRNQGGISDLAWLQRPKAIDEPHDGPDFGGGLPRKPAERRQHIRSIGCACTNSCR